MKTPSAGHAALDRPITLTAGAEKAPAHHASVGQGVSLRVATNGAKTPEAIPDYLAYRHFVMVTAVTATASANEVARRDAFLSQVGLSENDRASYLAALSGLGERLTSIARARTQLSPSATTSHSQLATLKLLQDQEFDGAQNRLRTWLSADGVKRLDDHIQTVKKCVVIYVDK